MGASVASAAMSCRRAWRLLLLTWLLLADVRACAPGRGHYRRRSPRKLTPLVFKQHVPNVSENTLGASGLPEGAITRQDPRFRKLVPNYSEDVIFKDEEGTGADRVMTQRGKEKLNTLAISVMNQWPGVRLRVTEGWDESGLHAPQSLHYEGRAVDITTSDRDRTKYGMLARLAVEVGFDWVYYESRSYIHCSVKSESVTRGRHGGCFSGETLAVLADGRRRRFDQLRRGDRVKAVDESGAVVDSEVILWLDRDPAERRLFYRLTTDAGRRLTVTPGHLIYVLDAGSAAAGNYTVADARVTFVKRVIAGDYVLVGRPAGGAPAAERVVAVDLVHEQGVFAPLTRHGTVLANGVLASCYAMVDDQRTAHAAFLPVRWTVNVRETARHLLDMLSGGRAARTARGAGDEPTSGVHWYADLLYSLSDYVLPRDMMLD